MNGEIFEIIYNFIINLLYTDNTGGNMSSWYQINGLVFSALGEEGSFFQNFSNSLSASFEIGEVSLMFVARLITSILFFILFVLLLKLFKWIFNFVFKLFRLN